MSTLIFFDPNQQDVKSDPWYKCRSIVDTYNRRVQRAWIPGWQLSVDELFVEWEGKGAYNRNSVDGMPHDTKEACKPRGVDRNGGKAHTKTSFHGKAHTKTSFHCHECSQNMEKSREGGLGFGAGGSRYMGLCSPATGRTCYMRHIHAHVAEWK